MECAHVFDSLSCSEVQSIVLSNIATISAERPVSAPESVDVFADRPNPLIGVCVGVPSLPLQNMFEPYLKSFFVHSSDPTHIRLLKASIGYMLRLDV